MRNYTLKYAAASIAVAAMVAAPIAAKKADSLRDLVGASGAGAETQLTNRGFEFISGDKSNNTSSTYCTCCTFISSSTLRTLSSSRTF